jgi:hypothetical protein
MSARKLLSGNSHIRAISLRLARIRSSKLMLVHDLVIRRLRFTASPCRQLPLPPHPLILWQAFPPLLFGLFNCLAR